MRTKRRRKGRDHTQYRFSRRIGIEFTPQVKRQILKMVRTRHPDVRPLQRLGQGRSRWLVKLYGKRFIMIMGKRNEYIVTVYPMHGKKGLHVKKENLNG